MGWAGAKLVLEGWTSLAERVLGQPDLALHPPKWTFWAVTVALLAVGTVWALRASRAAPPEGRHATAM